MESDIPSERRTERLAVPLRQPQIEAAERLHGRLEGWTACERAFEELRRDLPGYSCEAVLVKAAAIDRLYATNVRGQAIHQVVCRIAEVMRRPPEDPVAVVEAIIGEQGVGKRYPSFASKFAHFFIDPERFPIYDKFCRRQTAYHLGRPIQESYSALYRGVCDLVKGSGLSPSFRELDHYLWLAGTYHDFRDRGKRNFNAELLALFRNESPEVERDRKALLPAHW